MVTQMFSRKWAVGLTVMIFCMGAAAMVAWADPPEAPFAADWASSGHADADAEAFIHWGVEPNTVSTSCARCHSTPGHLDYLGADGSTPGEVNVAPLVGTTVECVACHNSVSTVMDSVVFPSGAEPTDLGPEARCMQCHQGRESTVSVDKKIEDANVPDDDTVSASLSFRNIHYLAAGATQFGGEVMGGYQYVGKSYDIKFAHVEGMDTCLDCHDQHTLEVKVERCGDCHVGIVAKEDLGHIRFKGSSKDYNGNGNVTEGISDEIAGLQVVLYDEILAYANSMGAPIVYDSHAYPYWFNDTNGNGQVDEGETRYGTWTARLVKATFNFQFSHKDPGAYAHNAKYVIQLLYDSIEDLNPAAVATLTRNDAGHFAGCEEPFRHWDEDGEVSASCAKCHSATGLPTYLELGINTAEPLSNGQLCTTCHDAVPGFTRHQVDEVEFPSGAVVTLDDPNSNICISCHQGRESTTSVNAAIAGLDPDTVNGSIRFKNIHYYPAGVTLLGAEVKGAYEYPGKVYKGRSTHALGQMDTCLECHDPHSLHPKEEKCAVCHGPTAPRDIRSPMGTPDYDADGNTTEGTSHELAGLKDILYGAIQTYATANSVPIIYAASYPYWFKDTNGNGVEDPGEATRSNGYNGSFTPALLQATFNYQYAKKDPGNFAHNSKYVAQVLYDSIEGLGADVSALTRPDDGNTTDQCGDPTHPYPPGDVNKDCKTNLLDVAEIGFSWLQDNNPQ